MKTKTVKLVFYERSLGRLEHIVRIPEDKGGSYIKFLFMDLMGVEFDKRCTYEVIG